MLGQIAEGRFSYFDDDPGVLHADQWDVSQQAPRLDDAENARIRLQGWVNGWTDEVPAVSKCFVHVNHDSRSSAVRPYSSFAGRTDSVAGGAAVTLSDSTDLTTEARALWVGGAGDVKVTLRDTSTVTLSAVPAGSMLPLQVTRVWATGTSATLIVALW